MKIETDSRRDKGGKEEERIFIGFPLISSLTSVRWVYLECRESTGRQAQLIHKARIASNQRCLLLDLAESPIE